MNKNWIPASAGMANVSYMAIKTPRYGLRIAYHGKGMSLERKAV